MHGFFHNVCINIKHGFGNYVTPHSSASASLNFQKHHVELAQCKNNQDHFFPYVHMYFNFKVLKGRFKSRQLEIICLLNY